jgi:hypothetical protein
VRRQGELAETEFPRPEAWDGDADPMRVPVSPEMIDQGKYYRSDWWNHAFCVEVDFKDFNQQCRSAWHYEDAFTAQTFGKIVDAFRDEFHFFSKAGILEWIKTHGSLRLRPGQLWCAPNYRGDLYDLPIVWDPFTRFPFGPMQ